MKQKAFLSRINRQIGDTFERDDLSKWQVVECIPSSPFDGRYRILANQIRKSKAPSIKTMEHWLCDGVAKATDGCEVEPDGICSHGKKSWLLQLGLI